MSDLYEIIKQMENLHLTDGNINSQGEMSAHSNPPEPMTPYSHGITRPADMYNVIRRSRSPMQHVRGRSPDYGQTCWERQDRKFPRERTRSSSPTPRFPIRSPSGTGESIRGRSRIPVGSIEIEPGIGETTSQFRPQPASPSSVSNNNPVTQGIAPAGSDTRSLNTSYGEPEGVVGSTDSSRFLAPHIAEALNAWKNYQEWIFQTYLEACKTRTQEAFNAALGTSIDLSVTENSHNCPEVLDQSFMNGTTLLATNHQQPDIALLQASKSGDNCYLQSPLPQGDHFNPYNPTFGTAIVASYNYGEPHLNIHGQHNFGLEPYLEIQTSSIYKNPRFYPTRSASQGTSCSGTPRNWNQRREIKLTSNVYKLPEEGSIMLPGAKQYPDNHFRKPQDIDCRNAARDALDNLFSSALPPPKTADDTVDDNEAGVSPEEWSQRYNDSEYCREKEKFNLTPQPKYTKQNRGNWGTHWGTFVGGLFIAGYIYYSF